MKAVFLFVVSFLVIPFRSFGQVGDTRDQIAIGVNAGLALNKVGFDPSIKQNYHLGPQLGLTLRFTNERYYKILCALQVELNYSILGWKENIIDASTNPLPDRYQRHQHYLQLPLLARLGFGKEAKGLMGFVVAGPQIAYLLTEKELRSDIWTLGNDGNPDRPHNMYQQYGLKTDNKLDYGITAGAGLEWHLSKGHLMLEGRYYYGLRDLFKNGKKDIFNRSNNSYNTFLFNRS